MSRVPDLSDLDLQLEDVEDYSSEYPTAEEDIRTSAENDVVKYRRGVITSLFYANKQFVMIAGTALVVLIAIISMASGSKPAPAPAVSTDDHAPLILVDPSNLDAAITDQLTGELRSMYQDNGIGTLVVNPFTPVQKALNWLSHDYDQDMDHDTRMTRYALAVLYYSTNDVPTELNSDPKTWYEADKWLSKDHACEWQGVDCNEKLHIVEIDLSRNNLSGKIPVELAALNEHLTSLILSENFIFMRGADYDALLPLTNLEVLLLDDNHLHGNNGFPTQFQTFVNLRKLKLSYNLFKGNIDSAKSNQVLAAMDQLTHLEMEACYLAGSMPHRIGHMSNLVYLYMRRNSMKFNLDFLKTGEMTDLFALWVDNNDVTGTIPTEVGLLESMASLSITNSTLTGTIPTQLGDMSSLRRLWLFNNQLTGSVPIELKKLSDLEILQVHHNSLKGNMPDGVCNVIHNSGSDVKSLTSDCDGGDIWCSDTCCTRCY